MSFLIGSLALIVLQALLGDNAAAGVEKGGRASAALLQRLLSPQIAGIPQRKSVTQQAQSTGGTAGRGALDDFLSGVASGVAGAGPARSLFPDSGFSFAPGEPQPRSNGGGGGRSVIR